MNISDYDKLKVRPGVQIFLESLEPYYKFVVFTAAQKIYADFVCRKIDPENKYLNVARFYRDSCKQIGKFQAKDLSLVIRELYGTDDRKIPISKMFNKIIIIDNLQESFQL